MLKFEARENRSRPQFRRTKNRKRSAPDLDCNDVLAGRNRSQCKRISRHAARFRSDERSAIEPDARYRRPPVILRHGEELARRCPMRQMKPEPEFPRALTLRCRSPHPVQAGVAVGLGHAIFGRKPSGAPVLAIEQSHFPPAGVAERGGISRFIPDLHAPPAAHARLELPAAIGDAKRAAQVDFAAVPEIRLSLPCSSLGARNPDAAGTLANVACVRLEAPGELGAWVFQTQWTVDVVCFQVDNSHAESP